MIFVSFVFFLFFGATFQFIKLQPGNLTSSQNQGFQNESPFPVHVHCGKIVPSTFVRLR